MARRRVTPTIDPLADLAKKVEILEREMAVQRQALARLKELGAPKRDADDHPVRRTA
jgi:hypothetical protein